MWGVLGSSSNPTTTTTTTAAAAATASDLSTTARGDSPLRFVQNDLRPSPSPYSKAKARYKDGLPPTPKVRRPGTFKPALNPFAKPILSPKKKNAEPIFPQKKNVELILPKKKAAEPILPQTKSAKLVDGGKETFTKVNVKGRRRVRAIRPGKLHFAKRPPPPPKVETVLEDDDNNNNNDHAGNGKSGCVASGVLLPLYTTVESGAMFGCKALIVRPHPIVLLVPAAEPAHNQEDLVPQDDLAPAVTMPTKSKSSSKSTQDPAVVKSTNDAPAAIITKDGGVQVEDHDHNYHGNNDDDYDDDDDDEVPMPELIPATMTVPVKNATKDNVESDDKTLELHGVDDTADDEILDPVTQGNSTAEEIRDDAATGRGGRLLKLRGVACLGPKGIDMAANEPTTTDPTTESGKVDDAATERGGRLCKLWGVACLGPKGIDMAATKPTTTDPTTESGRGDDAATERGGRLSKLRGVACLGPKGIDMAATKSRSTDHVDVTEEELREQLKLQSGTRTSRQAVEEADWTVDEVHAALKEIKRKKRDAEKKKRSRPKKEDCGFEGAYRSRYNCP